MQTYTDLSSWVWFGSVVDISQWRGFHSLHCRGCNATYSKVPANQILGVYSTFFHVGGKTGGYLSLSDWLLRPEANQHVARCVLMFIGIIGG